jgi:oxygen-independent coproporphyrinogen-3 oxidase
VPFCRKKCGYCSFYSENVSPEKKKKYLLSLQEEINLSKLSFKLQPRTIYFGGGTPSLLSGREIGTILKNFDLSEIEEITLEANPISISSDYAKSISQTWINRISLGIQSFRDQDLQLLNRLHTAKQAEDAFHILRQSNFKNISLDMIYGLPNQKESDLLFSLKKFIELQPEHISTYCLSLDNDAPLFYLKDQLPSDEIVSKFYFLIREKLLQAGYLQYEISNFARSGFESKHNCSYWNNENYLGFGPAASGYIDNFLQNIETKSEGPQNRKKIRYTNTADLKKHCRRIEDKQLFYEYEEISLETQEKEFIFLALRKTKGLNLAEFQRKFSIKFENKYKLITDKFLSQNLLEIESGFVRLKPDAYFVSNEILAEFM